MDNAPTSTAPVIELPRASASLQQQIDESIADNPERVIILELPDARMVIKRAADKPRSWLLSGIAGWLSMLVSGRMPSLSALRLAGSKKQLEYEAARLLQLKTAGINVPEVIAVSDHWLAMSFVGEPIDQQMPGLLPEEQVQLLEILGKDLAGFHRRGQWHGASQIRNVTTLNGDRYLIDFEENLARNIPIKALQAYDVLLFLSSCIGRHERNRKQDIQLAARLLQNYWYTNPDPRVATYLRRCYYLLAPLNWVLRPFERFLGRDGKRLLMIIEGLAQHFKVRCATSAILSLLAFAIVLLAVYD